MGFIKTIGFDADDTLWHNERFFGEAQIALKDLLSEYADGETISKAIQEAQSGDTIYVMDGTYRNSNYNLTKTLGVNPPNLNNQKVKKYVIKY